MLRCWFAGLLAVSCSTRALAWSWLSDTRQHNEPLLAVELSDTELSALFRSKSMHLLLPCPSERDIVAVDTIEAYHRRPDCFQDAMARVKSRCEESHMDEQERIYGTCVLQLA